MKQHDILIVDDDRDLREAIADVLEEAGYEVEMVADGVTALTAIGPHTRLVISDVNMQPMTGDELLQHMGDQHSGIPVILMTAYATIEKAVAAMRNGASDYLAKPFDSDQLIEIVEKYIAPEQNDMDSFRAKDDKMLEVLALAGRVAATSASVMITGKSGTGKEVIARYIHEVSDRKEQPFVAINCAAIPENMLEAVLFGYEKGAYTGAIKASAGKFERANGGTLLLDEISEMDINLQAKILRVLQENEVERLGSQKAVKLDVRVLATSNRNLREEIAAGRFREDLFYRLNVFPLHLPELKDRPADIVEIGNALLAKHHKEKGVAPVISDSAEQKLIAYNWPGNVRELENVMQRALILSGGKDIRDVDLIFEEQQVSAAISAENLTTEAVQTASAEIEEELGLKNQEQRTILSVLKAVGGSRKTAAKKLGISPRTLRYKLSRMREAGISIPAVGGAEVSNA